MKTIILAIIACFVGSITTAFIISKLKTSQEHELRKTIRETEKMMEKDWADFVSHNKPSKIDSLEVMIINDEIVFQYYYIYETHGIELNVDVGINRNLEEFVDLEFEYENYHIFLNMDFRLGWITFGEMKDNPYHHRQIELRDNHLSYHDYIGHVNISNQIKMLKRHTQLWMYLLN